MDISRVDKLQEYLLPLSRGRNKLVLWGIKESFTRSLCKGPQSCEPVLPQLEVGEFGLTFALSKLLTTGVATNVRFWPRVWFISILDGEVDPLHLDQREVGEFESLPYTVLMKSVTSSLPFGVKYKSVWTINEVDSGFTECPSWCYSVSVSISPISLSFCLIILTLTLLPWNIQVWLKLAFDKSPLSLASLRDADSKSPSKLYLPSHEQSKHSWFSELVNSSTSS